MNRVIASGLKLSTSSRWARVSLAVLGVLWLSALAGFIVLAAYDSKPGAVAAYSSQWPTASHLKLAKKASTAVVFLHPGCACSMATLTELSKVMDICKDLKVYALVWQPGKSAVPAADDHAMDLLVGQNSRLYRYAGEIPGITLVPDPEGAESEKFGAKTSGYVMVYSHSGRLLFTGGITESRGHEGDNEGADALVSAVRNSRRNTIASTPVFGCSLSER